jgi:ATP-dependent exoDNAse (exonuclease V) alpha subunit
VIGLATSTNAARVMIGEGLPEGYNTAQFLGKIKDSDETRGAMPIGANDVLVIDEASQVSTADLARIVAVAKAARARVVPTGDTAQLGAVEAGGLMRLIAHDLGHWELHEVRRFDAARQRFREHPGEISLGWISWAGNWPVASTDRP